MKIIIVQVFFQIIKGYSTFSLLFFPPYRPPNPIEFLAAYLLKNKAQFEDRN